MNILQDIMGLITKRKIKTPSDNDYIVSAAYTDTQERLKPQPKMEASLLNIGALKKFILSSIAPPKYKVYTVLLSQNGGADPQVNSVLEDTINQPFTFTYEEQGRYRISSPAFNNENLLKTSIALSQSVEQRIVNIQSNTLEDGYVFIYCQAIGGGRADDGIYYATLEIRVYN